MSIINHYSWVPEITQNRLPALMSKSLINILNVALVGRGNVRIHMLSEPEKSILISEKELSSAIHNDNLTEAGLDSYLVSKGLTCGLSQIRFPGRGSIYQLPISEKRMYLGHTWIMDDRGSSSVKPFERIHIVENINDVLPFETDMSEQFDILYAGNSDKPLTRSHITSGEIHDSIVFIRQGDKVWHKVMLHDSDHNQSYQTPHRLPPPVLRKIVTSNQNRNIQCLLPDGSPFLVNTFDKDVVRLLAILYICKKSVPQYFTKEEMAPFLERKKRHAEEISRSGRLVPFLKNLYNAQMNVHRENFMLVGHIHWMYTEKIDITSREIIFD
jgi:uncharacterized pyridoxamine 5'-phosphate oxidase family protein